MILQTQVAPELATEYRSRLANDCPQQSAATRESIIAWLLGEDLERYDSLTSTQLEIARQAITYRCWILQKRYLGVAPERGYRHLMQRLGGLPILQQKICTLVALSRDRHRTVVDVLQEVLQELLHRDSYMQQQIRWIAECTSDRRLQNSLLFASLEEYCLRPIRRQPLISYRSINYLRRSARGGLTQIAKRDLVKLMSEENLDRDSDSRLSWLDNEAIAVYQATQTWEEQQALRDSVKQEFSNYIETKLGIVAVQWLQLYLQGWSQQAIATHLNLDIRQVYRLREKVTYHAVRNFTPQNQSLLDSWLDDATTIQPKLHSSALCNSGC